MIPENPRRTYAFVCPGCLTVYHLFIWEIEEGVPKCNYCHVPLERIKSRLNAKQLEFNHYNESDLSYILKRRAELALHPDSWSDKTLKKIAALAEGDARVAIQTLKNSAYHAETDFSRTIREKHVKEGYNSAKVLNKSYLLDRLTSHHRLLRELVKERKEINSGELWKAYLAKCGKLKKPPIALRTFSEYMNKLIELDLVKWDRALVRGKVRVFKVPG